VASTGYQEGWLSVVELKRSGLFGMGRKSTYELLGDDRRFTTLELLAELLGPNHYARRDAYECIARATSIFPNGRGEWVGIPPVQGGPIRWPPMWRRHRSTTLWPWLSDWQAQTS
jgi:hypothetical protein